MAKITDSKYIIAIGASAGGLEAISSFFDYTPLDGVSYIVIQHLSSDFKSQMAHILDKHSKLEVIEVTDHETIEVNKVYLIPSSKFMTIESGKLILSDKKDHPAPYKTIDYFFISLAKERKNKAIGIIFSGTGNDGSEGIQAIKKAGGIVIVQDPVTANFDGMPLAAIRTGCADLILSPQAMPQVIEDYLEDGILEIIPDTKENDLDETILLKIIHLIKEFLPLDFTDYKRPTLLRRIKRRMIHNNFTLAHKYYEFLKDNPTEIQKLSNDFLIGVTSFFRDPEAFKLIEKTVIPAILFNRPIDDVAKIWIAGCATGEEAYSIAILAKEYMLKSNRNIEVKIFATDINKASLDKASKGVFTEIIEQSVSKTRLKNFFTKEDNTYKIKHDIRKMLIFAQHDLVKNPPYCNIDLICCRNLLIYMNLGLQKKVFSMMHFGLKKDGYLFLGPSENAAVLKTDFHEISNKWNILKSNKSARSIRFNTFSSPIIEGPKTADIENSKKTAAPASPLAVVDDINTAILEESGFSGVVTDENLNVIRSFGNPGNYLKNEIFNFNLYDLLPDAISIALKAAAYKSVNNNKRIVLNDLKFTVNNKSAFLNMVIRPLFSKKTGLKTLLILFVENNNQTAKQRIAKPINLEVLTKEHLINLEQELAETKQNLEIAYERIESSNENMQSFNEELLSANEEMQSANEELQSVNEELQTINKEHQITNAELTDLNDDLNNYFRSNINGQLFVDKDLLLKKYSPGAIKHINIRESDIGRPIGNITTNIKFETLVEDIKKVIENDETIIREAESSEGNIYQVTTIPYIKKDNKHADGAIISFYDITELKRLMRELDASNKSLLRINGDLNNFVYGASHDLKAPINNIDMALSVLNKKIGKTNPELSKLSDMMNSAIKTFNNVINDLSKVGAIEAEMLEECNSESFEAIYEEITEIISERIKQANAHFHLDFQEKEIRFPRKNLRSILLNLITNAIKFSSSERLPEITIKTEKVDGFILLTVKDNGIGINPDRLDFVFKMYQRINNDVEGQGIGLYLIRKIIDASGGKIEVESEKNNGSTFKIFFKN